MTSKDVLLWLAAGGPFVIAAGFIYIRSYIGEKAANLARKEDVEQLTRIVESVKSEFRVREELHKRRSKVHALQVKALLDLYANLLEISDLLKPVVAAAPWAGPTYEDAGKKLVDPTTKAERNYHANKLLLPGELVEQVDKFFNKYLDALAVTNSMRNAVAPNMEEWQKRVAETQSVAAQELPQLLRSIEHAARSIIYGPEG